MRKSHFLPRVLAAFVLPVVGSISLADRVVSYPPESFAKIASMKGRVFNSDLNQPISNALITLRNFGQDISFEARTDERGSYKFPDIPGGVYTITIRVPDSEKVHCHLYLQNLQAEASAFSADALVASIAGFSIVGGKENVQDFDFSCKKNALAEKRQKEALGPTLKLLEQKGVPFESKLLLDDEWRVKLETAFQQIPELQKDLRATSPLNGLYLARTMFLPERVELKEDTVILVRDFAPVDSNSSIWIAGKHRLVILVIGDPSRPRPAIPRWPSKFLRIDTAGICALSGIPRVYNLTIGCDLRWLERR